jgi:hypothetical protein
MSSRGKILEECVERVNELFDEHKLTVVEAMFVMYNMQHRLVHRVEDMAKPITSGKPSGDT